MIFINDISSLDYYHPIEGVPCYCEKLVYPADLYLQGAMGTVQLPAGISYVVKIQVLSADGLTIYEDATAYFSWYIAINPVTNRTIINIHLNSFSPAMCAYNCWILYVTVENTVPESVWFGYTQRYCNSTCCDIPRGVIITQDGVDHRTNEPAPSPTEPAISTTTECGWPLIRLRSVYECANQETGKYYGLPDDVLQSSGNLFSFVDLVNIAGKIAQRPREIKREVSYNCRLQRSESFRPFRLESVGWSAQSMFPTWKMNEIEGMFEANHIYVYDYVNIEREYLWPGGTLMEKVFKCWEMFKLGTSLQDCTHRNNFGCGEPCTLLESFFAIGEQFEGGAYYNENKQLIATTWNDLLIWIAGQTGVIEVTDLSGDYPELTGAFSVSYTGLIPTFFYADGLYQRNKVFSTPEIILLVIGCVKPVIGAITVTDNVCATPTIGTITVTDVPITVADIVGFGIWEDNDDSEVNVGSEICMLHFSLQSEDYPEVTDPYNFTGEIVGQMEAVAWPAVPQYFDHTNYDVIPDGNAVAIDTNGLIRWYGPPTTQNPTYAEVAIGNIYYPLN